MYNTIFKRIILCSTIFITLLLSLHVLAEEKQTSASMKELQQLFDKDAFSELYLLGQNLLYEYEGTPRFDLIYGISAMETGNINESVFIFERLVEDSPSNLRYRLELGRAYFLQEEYVKSKAIFEGILKSQADLPKPVVIKITGFLSAIQNKTGRNYAKKKNAFNGFVGLATGYDDNAGSVSTIDTFLVSDPTTGATGNAPFTNEEQGTSYASTQIAGQYTRFIDDKTSFVLLGVGQHKNNYKTEAYQYEIGSLLIGADIKRLFDKNLLTMGVKFNNLRRAGENLFDNNSARINLKHALNSPLIDLISADLSYSEIRYNDTAESSEADSSRLTVSIKKRKNKILNNASLILGQDDAVLKSADYNSRSYYGVSYSLNYAHTQKISFSGNLLVQRSQYDDVFPSAVNQAQSSGNLEKRDGLFTSLSLGSAYAFSKHVSFQVNASAIDSDSDLNLYTYTNNKIEMGATYQF